MPDSILGPVQLLGVRGTDTKKEEGKKEVRGSPANLDESPTTLKLLIREQDCKISTTSITVTIVCQENLPLEDTSPTTNVPPVSNRSHQEALVEERARLC